MLGVFWTNFIGIPKYPLVFLSHKLSFNSCWSLHSKPLMRTHIIEKVNIIVKHRAVNLPRSHNNCEKVLPVSYKQKKILLQRYPEVSPDLKMIALLRVCEDAF